MQKSATILTFILNLTFLILPYTNAISSNEIIIDSSTLNSTNIIESSITTTSQSTYSAAAGFAHEVNHDYYVAGAVLMAAAVILL